MTLWGLIWYEWLCLSVLTYLLSWIAYPYLFNVKGPESEVIPYSRGYSPSWGNFPKEEEQ